MGLNYLAIAYITIGIISFVFSGSSVVALVKCRSQVLVLFHHLCTFVVRDVLTWRVFFWLANIICMVFSGLNAGFLFGLYEPLGLAVAFVIDILIIVLMQAMLAAYARAEVGRARWIIGVIFVLALLSTVGNIAHNIQVQDVSKIDHLAPWFQSALPFVASSTPLLLVIFALVADLVTRSNPLDGTSLEDYRAQEAKRLDLLAIQIEHRERRAQLMKRLHLVEQMERQNKGKNVPLQQVIAEQKVEQKMPLPEHTPTSEKDLEQDLGTEQEMTESQEIAEQDAEQKSIIEEENVEQEEQQKGSIEEVDFSSQADIDTEPEMPSVSFQMEAVPAQPQKQGRIRSKTLEVKAVAQLLGCSERHVRNLRTRGVLKSDAEGKLLAQSVQAYLKKQSKTPAPERQSA